MTSPLRKPDGLSWNPAAVELPEIPMLPPGEDAMSATIAAVLPTLAAPLAANVAALSAKEHAFTGKLGVAQTAYTNADDSGQQGIGQITSALGQLDQLGQQAGGVGQGAGGLGGQTGMFSSLMEQVMKAAQGAGGAEPAGEEQGGPVGAGMAGPAGHGGPGQGAQQSRDGLDERREEPGPDEHRPDEQVRTEQQPRVEEQPPAQQPESAAAGGGGQGPAPIAQPAPSVPSEPSEAVGAQPVESQSRPEQPVQAWPDTRGGDDIARRM